MFKKVNPFQILLFGAILSLAVTQETTIRTCVDNEERKENQIACYGQDFGALVPYPGNCAKFLVCNCEYPTVKDCAPGTWFDNKLKICNFPQNVECDNSGGDITSTTTSMTTTTSTTTTTTPELEWGQNCEPPEGMSSDLCLNYDNDFLLRYPYNCNAYINCTQGCPVMTYCLPDKVFNAFLKICDTPETAHCESLPMPSTTTTPEPTTTTTEKYTTTSSTTTQPTTVTTTTEEPITTSTTTIQPTTLSTTTEEPTTTTQPTTMTTTTEEPSTTNTTTWPYTTTTPVICDPPYGVSEDVCKLQAPGTDLPYPYNCSAYIHCNWLCPHLKYCGPKEVFNTHLGRCDSADNVECIEISYPTEGTSEPPTTTTDSDTTWSETTDIPCTNKPVVCDPPPGISNDICAQENPGTLLPYPYNCTAYIGCNWLCPHLQYCGPNKVYNSMLGICDSANNVQCYEIPYPNPETTEPSTATTDNGTDWPESTTDNPIASTLPPDVNPELCEGQQDYKIFPYAGNCSEYLMCLKGKVQIKSCQNGWLFNSELGMCDKAGEEFCYKETSTTETSTHSTRTTTTSPEKPVYDFCLDKPNGTTYPYTQDCHMYYYCRGDGTYYLVACPANNFYEPYSGDCGPNVSPAACKIPLTTTTTASTTQTPAEKCEKASVGDTFAYEADCHRYIMCMGSGSYKILNCPNDNLYHPDSGDCGPSEDENICRKGSEQGSTTTTTVKPTTTTTTIPISTVAPSNGVCGNYTNGELIPYPENCQKYISCVRPIPVGFFCPDNWYFEASQQKCRPDTNGSCYEPSSTTTIAPPSDICVNQEKGEWQIYPDNCEMYYECLGNGYYMLQICTEGEYFDPLRGKCSADVNANYCQQDFDTTTVITPTESPKPPQNLCWGKPIGSKIPYPHDCSKYIVCDLPIPVGHNCPNGLQYSSLNETCVNPEDSDCGSTSITSTTIEPISTTPSQPITACYGKPDLTLLPYEMNCSLFVICVNNEENIAHCHRDQYFDAYLGKCSSDANKDSCLSDQTTTTLEPPTSDTTIDPNLGPCYGKPEGTKLPYPDNCDKYIVCRNPIPVGYNCTDGLEFSEALSECVSPELANCSIKTTTEIPQTTTTPPKGEITCEGLPNGSTLTYPDDCSKYYICLNGNPRLTSCMANSYYNPESEQCDSTSETSCHVTEETTTPSTTTTIENDEDTCSREKNGYTYPNTEDCSQYYMCLSGSAYLTNCSSNSYYDPQIGQCNRQTSSEACKELATTSTIDEESTTSTSIITSTDNPVVNTTSSPVTTTTDNSNTTTTDIPITSTTDNPITTTTNTLNTTTTNMPVTTTTDTPGTTTTDSPVTITTDSSVTSTTGTPVTTTTDIPAVNTTSTPIITTTDTPITSTTDTPVITTTDSPVTTTTDTPIATTTSTPVNTTTDIPAVSSTTTPVTTTTVSPITTTTISPVTTTTVIPATTTTTGTTIMTTTSTAISTAPTEPTPPRHDNICCGKDAGTLLPYPEDNTKYVICQYPLPLVAECPSGSVFNPTKGLCESKLQVVEIPLCSKMPYGTGLSYQGDCSKYYLCFGSKAMIMSCKEGCSFNAALGSCVYSHLYNCPW